MADVILWKGIRPKRLEIAAFAKAILAQAESVADDIVKDFEKTVKTWRNKPTFDVLVDVKPDGPTILVGTDDEIYNYVDAGTRPHKILPKNAPLLRFQPGYVAKTSPGVIGSQAGGSFGDFVYSAGVDHPGTDAREFSVEIQKKWKRPFKREMEDAMKMAAKNSGWGK